MAYFMRCNIRRALISALFKFQFKPPLYILLFGTSGLREHFAKMDLDFDSSQNTGYVLNDSLIALNKAWSTETNAIEILPYKDEVVQELQEQLEQQQENIDQKIEDGIEEEYFVVTLYQMDIERVRYSLARYLRTRLLKIERSLEYILSNIDVMDRLSMQEKEFATKLSNLNTSYFEDNVTNRFQLSDAKDHYEQSDNRLQHAKPAEKVLTNSLPPYSPIFFIKVAYITSLMYGFFNTALCVLSCGRGYQQFAAVLRDFRDHDQRRHQHCAVLASQGLCRKRSCGPTVEVRCCCVFL